MGYSLIFAPQFPNSEASVHHVEAKLALKLIYDKSNVLDVPDMSTVLYPIGYGYRTRKIAGRGLEEKIELLADEDVNVVESVVRVLGTIGDSAALPGLNRLMNSDLGYLKSYYQRETIEKLPLPPGSRRNGKFSDEKTLLGSA